MKKKLCFIALFACILSLPALDIVKNKKACARIVVNPAAGKLEKMGENAALAAQDFDYPELTKKLLSVLEKTLEK